LYTTSWHPDGCVSRWLCIDIDHHGDGAPPESNLRAGEAWHGVLIRLGFHPVLLDSNGNGGYRLYLIFDKPIRTASARRLGLWLIRDWRERGLAGEPECFPKQEEVTPKGSGSGSFGNWVRLPGRHHKRPHWSRVWNSERWLEGDEAINAILATTGDDPRLIPEAAITITDPPARRTLTPPATPQDDRHTDHTHHPHVVSSAVAPKVGQADDVTTTRVRATDIKRARQALRYLRPGAKDPSGHEYVSDYHLWVRVGMALHGLGDAGLDLWIRWSRGCPDKFSEADCRSKWSTFRHGSGVNLGWLFHEAKGQGWGVRKEG
jgi:hypothetical protein